MRRKDGRGKRSTELALASQVRFGCGGLHVPQKQEIRGKLVKIDIKHDEHSEQARDPHRWTAGHALVRGSEFTTKAATLQGK
jgi:hypothetical protein